jgi:hypothetical protein
VNVFTDDDLKRLKDEISDPLYQQSENRQMMLANYSALVARLKAAEAVIREIDDNGFTYKALTLHDAWLKAAGK